MAGIKSSHYFLCILLLVRSWFQHPVSPFSGNFFFWRLPLENLWWCIVLVGWWPRLVLKFCLSQAEQYLEILTLNKCRRRSPCSCYMLPSLLVNWVHAVVGTGRRFFVEFNYFDLVDWSLSKNYEKSPYQTLCWSSSIHYSRDTTASGPEPSSVMTYLLICMN